MCSGHQIDVGLVAVVLVDDRLEPAREPSARHVSRERRDLGVVRAVVAERRQLLAIDRVVDRDADVGVVPRRFVLLKVMT